MSNMDNTHLQYLCEFGHKEQWLNHKQNITPGHQVIIAYPCTLHDGEAITIFFVGIVKIVNSFESVMVYPVKSATPKTFTSFEKELNKYQSIFTKKGTLDYHLPNIIPDPISMEAICSYNFEYRNEFINFWINMPFCVEMSGLDTEHVQVKENITGVYNTWHISDKTERMIIKYMLFGYLGPEDKLEQGFFDVGRANLRKDFSPNLVYYIKTYTGGREIIQIGEPTKKWKKFIRINKEDKEISVKILVQAVSILVDEMMGKDCSDSESKKDILDISKKQGGSNVVNLFDITKGVCRHKSLMLKYVLDQLGIPCALIRGNISKDINIDKGRHIWNIVQIEGKCYLIDVRNASDQLIDTTSDLIPQFFKNFRRVDKEIGHVGVTVMQ